MRKKREKKTTSIKYFDFQPPPYAAHPRAAYCVNMKIEFQERDIKMRNKSL